MAAGVPGVSTDVGGVADVIVSPEVGTRGPGHRASPGRGRGRAARIADNAPSEANAPGRRCWHDSASIDSCAMLQTSIPRC